MLGRPPPTLPPLSEVRYVDDARLRTEVEAQQRQIAQMQEQLRACMAAYQHQPSYLAHPPHSPVAYAPHQLAAPAPAAARATSAGFETHAQEFNAHAVIINSVVTACSFVQALAWRDVIDQLVKFVRRSASAAAREVSSGELTIDETDDAFASDPDPATVTTTQALTDAVFEALCTSVLCVAIAFVAIRCMRPCCSRSRATVKP